MADSLAPSWHRKPDQDFDDRDSGADQPHEHPQLGALGIQLGSEIHACSTAPRDGAIPLELARSILSARLQCSFQLHERPILVIRTFR